MLPFSDGVNVLSFTRVSCIRCLLLSGLFCICRKDAREIQIQVFFTFVQESGLRLSSLCSQSVLSLLQLWAIASSSMGVRGWIVQTHASFSAMTPVCALSLSWHHFQLTANSHVLWCVITTASSYYLMERSGNPVSFCISLFFKTTTL